MSSLLLPDSAFDFLFKLFELQRMPGSILKLVSLVSYDWNRGNNFVSLGIINDGELSRGQPSNCKTRHSLSRTHEEEHFLLCLKFRCIRKTHGNGDLPIHVDPSRSCNRERLSCLTFQCFVYLDRCKRVESSSYPRSMSLYTATRWYHLRLLDQFVGGHNGS